MHVVQQNGEHSNGYVCMSKPSKDATWKNVRRTECSCYCYVCLTFFIVALFEGFALHIWSLSINLLEDLECQCSVQGQGESVWCGPQEIKFIASSMATNSVAVETVLWSRVKSSGNARA